MTYHELDEDTELGDIMTTKGVIDAYLEKLGARMHKATGVRLANYVSTDLHEVTIVSAGITKWQLLLWVSPDPLPARARDWLGKEVLVNQIRRRQEAAQDFFLIISKARTRVLCIPAVNQAAPSSPTPSGNHATRMKMPRTPTVRPECGYALTVAGNRGPSMTRPGCEATCSEATG